ncbi:MAG: low molecular weight phosphotyrosine protein phosphatase [Paludibacteraceae bacterium]|nr:low molecular weight phosphotyrosine protein phosphatase [Paludibacteraceae bacterium]
MTRILFLCHGNICRSPMAEYLMRYLVEQQGRTRDFDIASAAVSDEETGNDIYPPAKRKLTEKGIPFGRHAARRVTSQDYDRYDRIVCMDHSNIRLLTYRIGADTAGKVSLLLDWAGESRDVADPWYTGDFEATYRDLLRGCSAMLRQL